MPLKVVATGKGRRKTNMERFLECLTCEYYEECGSIENPQDNPDGSCKERDRFRERIEHET